MKKHELIATGLVKRFSTPEGEFSAVKDFTFSFPAAGLMVFTGESGSGKTTLLHLLSGLQTPTEGEVRFHGVAFDGSRIARKTWSQAFAFVFQEGNLLENKTVKENLLLASPDLSLIENELRRFGVEGKLDVPVSRLSGGEKQRIAIARAFIKGASVLVFDEPTASLDKARSEEVFQAIKEASRTKLCLVSTHNQELACRYGDVRFVLEDGKVVSTFGEIPSLEETPECEPRRGKLSIFYACKALVRKKGKAIATGILATLSFMFVTVGASFSFYDARPVFAEALRKEGAWAAPLTMKEWNEPTEWYYSFSCGSYIQKKAEDSFDRVLPYVIARHDKSQTKVYVMPYFPGMRVLGREIENPGADGVAVSSFLKEIVGDAFSLNVDRYAFDLRVAQEVPVDYDATEMANHLSSPSYQGDHRDRFLLRYAFAIVSPELLASPRYSGSKVSLPASDLLFPDYPLSYYADRIANYDRYENQPLAFGRAPIGTREVAVSLEALPAEYKENPGSIVGKTFEYRDLEASPNRVLYRDRLNLAKVFDPVTVVGVVQGEIIDNFYVDDAFFETLLKAKWENELGAMAYLGNVSQMAERLNEGVFRTGLQFLEPAYRLNNLAHTTISQISIVTEVLFCIVSAAVMFSLGQDNIAGKEKEIALLETLGFETADLALRFFIAVAIFAFGTLLVGAVLSLAAISAINAILSGPQLFGVSYSLLHFSWWGLGLAAVVGCLISLLSTGGSLRRLVKLQISDIFRGKE